ncbi:hypothetical protein [Pseudoalteromonas aurantia]|uniref:Uncharacterized protein n=1 Tax=Pseudoalteromonas aurantia TaxID=43654 RepID=A0A5S3VFE1_9GAMM|nr:hypothetical protein [Pseudoalteromonas aurantia]TMO70697.1 hypothetical protein CWC19_00170 [Pseudoalteromonas aurantia]
MSNDNTPSPQIEQEHSGTGHNVAGDLTIYNIDNVDLSTELAIASLIGCWNEKNSNDISIVEALIDESYSSWVKKVRVIEGLDNSPLVHNRGIWKFKDRLNTFKTVSSRLFDPHIKNFKTTVTEVLSTIDTQYELKPENRFAASIYGKGFPHSTVIREGLSEGLAIIATAQNDLSNCSKGIGQFVASEVVSSVLSCTDWKLWASTQDVQIMLAEAAPDSFIDAAENAVSSTDKPFDSLFAQEGDGGITGRNYLTGLLWALEGLAWSPELLSRSLVLLGEMDNHDPGGNWANRPSNSIANILLPWLPHTTANIDLRFAAFNALKREFPDTAWKVILQLLPDNMRTTFGTHTPTYRKFIPDDFQKDPSDEEYNKQIVHYCQSAVQLAKQDSIRIAELVDNLANLTKTAFDSAIDLLDSFASSNTDDEEKLSVWEHCLEIRNKHKKFSDAQWAMPQDQVDKLSVVIRSLKPTDHRLFNRRLFGQRSYDLFEDNGNWREQEEKLAQMRNEAVTSIFNDYEISGLLEFAETIYRPDLAGNATSASGINIPNELMKSLMTNDNSSFKQFVSGYVWSKNHLEGTPWVRDVITNWEHDELIQLFLLLPFNMETWALLEATLAGNETAYWESAYSNAYHCDSTDDSYYAVDKLLENNRPLAAIDCLSRVLNSDKSVDEARAITALLMAINTSESSKSIDVYHLSEIVKFLQKSDNVSSDDLVKIEWAYLPLINRKSNDDIYPQQLENKLASEPEFFCEMIQLAFRSSNQEEIPELNESQKNIANNAYDLLDSWNTIPGSVTKGNFEKDTFYDWFNKVKVSCEETGHLGVSYQIIGKALFASPSEPDVCWIHSDLAELLNRRELDDVRVGFRNAIYNSRGAHYVDPEGKPEIALADDYKNKANQIELLGFQRFARMLREVAESYQSEAESIIERHSKRQD